jgi:adenine-specific DNA-methyltransferase
MNNELFERNIGVLSGLLNGRTSVPLSILPEEREVLVSNQWDDKADLCLYLGDAFELVRAIPDETVRLTVTSPPYNIGKEYERKLDLDEYIRWHSQIIREAYRITMTGGSICWQVGNWVKNSSIIPIDYLLYPIFKDLGLVMRNRIVWHFRHGLHASKRFSGRYEVIMWFTKGEPYVFNLDAVRVPQKYPNKKFHKGPNKGKPSCNPLGKNPTDVWDIPNVKWNHPEKTEHPAQFPVELAERLVLALTNEGEWVFDPFMGVMSTAIAALKRRRRFVGAEINKKYYQIGLKRLTLFSQGKLKLREIGTPIYEPTKTKQKLL